MRQGKTEEINKDDCGGVELFHSSGLQSFFIQQPFTESCKSARSLSQENGRRKADHTVSVNV